MTQLPEIIQGGMGVAVSSRELANTMARMGQMGVVSGTALDVVLSRSLQLGDKEGNLRRAIAAFPDQDVAARVLKDFFIEGGKAEDKAFKASPMYTADAKRRSHDLAVMGGFVEVFLAKEGHDGLIGINFLEKIQLPTPATLYGALLAGVDYVLVGAGIPRGIPGLIDSLKEHQPVDVAIKVLEAPDGEKFSLHFDPKVVMPGDYPSLPRPKFLAIIASATLALSLFRKTPGIDGWIIEGPTAGGHNAPPRGTMVLENGEPVYGPRDEVDLAKIRELGLPFWLAGGQATPERLREAQANGAAGIQVGTAFAFCEESGMDPGLRKEVIDRALHGGIGVFTDPLASPTGFPFKVVQLEGTLAEEKVFLARERRCDLGYLRDPYRKEDGTLGYRCASEPIEDYLEKGGDLADTVGRKCICNGLLATITMGQRRSDFTETPIVTAGDDLQNLDRFLPSGKISYTAADVVAYLLDTPAP